MSQYIKTLRKRSVVQDKGVNDFLGCRVWVWGPSATWSKFALATTLLFSPQLVFLFPLVPPAASNHSTH